MAFFHNFIQRLCAKRNQFDILLIDVKLTQIVLEFWMNLKDQCCVVLLQDLIQLTALQEM